jgi:nucleotide-binding universal stress UspA family protein
MFKLIVWGTDGSEHADRALPLVTELGNAGATVIVVHDDEHFAGRASQFSVLAEEPEVRVKIEGQVDLLRKQGVDASLQLTRHSGADPADVIAAIADETGADLIVVGTRGHGRVAGALLGSVAQRLLKVAPCPVLAVPPAVRVKETEQEKVGATA